MAESTRRDAGLSFHLVDEELRTALLEFPEIPVGEEHLPVLRARALEPLLPEPAPQPVVRTIPGAADHPKLEVLVIDPAPNDAGKAALLHVHGGGYFMGSPEASATSLQRYAIECGCVIVSVRYRLAPEAAFPKSLEDIYAALLWLHGNAAELGVDPARIGVGGESAGGGHAAALALAARDRNGPPLAFQFLIYPMLDDRTGTSRPVSPLVGEFVWTAEHNRFGWEALLGGPAGGDVPAGAVPARAEDLSALPRAYIATGALDLFVEENLLYAARLIAAGVPVEVYVEPGGFHGFGRMAPDAAVSRRFNARITEALRALTSR